MAAPIDSYFLPNRRRSVSAEVIPFLRAVLPSPQDIVRAVLKSSPIALLLFFPLFRFLSSSLIYGRLPFPFPLVRIAWPGYIRFSPGSCWRNSPLTEVGLQ